MPAPSRLPLLLLCLALPRTAFLPSTPPPTLTQRSAPTSKSSTPSLAPPRCFFRRLCLRLWLPEPLLPQKPPAASSAPHPLAPSSHASYSSSSSSSSFPRIILPRTIPPRCRRPPRLVLLGPCRTCAAAPPDRPPHGHVLVAIACRPILSTSRSQLSPPPLRSTPLLTGAPSHQA
jgi:hypothetical protein